MSKHRQVFMTCEHVSPSPSYPNKVERLEGGQEGGNRSSKIPDGESRRRVSLCPVGEHSNNRVDQQHGGKSGEIIERRL